MAKASPAIVSFNSGEFSPLLAARSDLKYYNAACKRLLNAVPTVQGPVQNRSGTVFAAEVKDSADRTWLRRFVFNEDQAYILEFGDQYIRFYTDHGVIESSPGVPYEIATVFTAASLTSNGLFNLRFVQSGDVLYITSNGQFPTQKLTRLTATTFSITELKTTGGPFKDIDPDQTITVYASAATGVGITLTASAALFSASHVGMRMFIEQNKTDDIKQWEPGKSVALGAIRRSDGKNYKALNAATTGSIKPVHSYGARYDGDAGVQWEFQDPGYGWVEITAFTDATHVTATVISKIPDEAVGSGNASNRWAFDLFSSIDGYPDNITIFRERLVLSRGLKLAMSVVSDFENFNKYDDGGLITADMAIQSDITSSESNGITWMAPMSAALLVGTSGEEYAVDELTPSEAFGPGNVKSNRQSSFGSRFIEQAIVGSGVIFVQKSGRKLRDMVLAESVEERWTSANLNVLSNHITKSGLVQLAYQQEPHSVVWCLKNDGTIAGFTIDREQDVRGWHPHKIGGSFGPGAYGVVESIETIPTPEGDELWMIVKRTINGSTVRYVEYMSGFFESGSNKADALFVDSGLTLNNVVNTTLTPGTGADVNGSTGVVFTAGGATFSSGDIGRHIHFDYEEISIDDAIVYKLAIAEITWYTDATHVICTVLSPWPDLSVIAANGWRMTVTTISGLDHLEGETVSILGDGAVYPQAVVSSGSITVDEPLSIAHVGLPYKSVIRPMPIEAGAADGTSQGKTKRISRAVLRLDSTAGIEYGPDEITFDPMLLRDAEADMDAGPELFTGNVVVSWPEGYSDEQSITIIQRNPLPVCVVGLFPQITTMDQR